MSNTVWPRRGNKILELDCKKARMKQELRESLKGQIKMKNERLASEKEDPNCKRISFKGERAGEKDNCFVCKKEFPKNQLDNKSGKAKFGIKRFI